jgi:hypothetical protein
MRHRVWRRCHVEGINPDAGPVGGGWAAKDRTTRTFATIAGMKKLLLLIVLAALATLATKKVRSV